MKRVMVLVAVLAAAAAAGMTYGLMRDGKAAPRATPLAQMPVTKPTLLMAVDAHDGTFTPVAGTSGEWTLTLNQVHPRALYFTDRPFHRVGAVPLAGALESFFAKTPTGAPNAALNTVDRTGHQVLMGAELVSYRYDRSAGRLVYRVRALEQDGGARSDRGRTDVVLPKTLGHTAVFLDGATNVAASFDPGSNDPERHTCSVHVANLLATDVSLSAASTSDSWFSYPPATIVEASESPRIESVARDDSSGCANSTSWSVFGLGTVSISVSDPRGSGNHWSCSFTTPFQNVADDAVQCAFTRDWGSSPATYGGNHLEAAVLLCSDDPRISIGGEWATCASSIQAQGGAVG